MKSGISPPPGAMQGRYASAAAIVTPADITRQTMGSEAKAHACCEVVFSGCPALFQAPSATPRRHSSIFEAA
jgi:hypothetical protein